MRMVTARYLAADVVEAGHFQTSTRRSEEVAPWGLPCVRVRSGGGTLDLWSAGPVDSARRVLQDGSRSAPGAVAKLDGLPGPVGIQALLIVHISNPVERFAVT